MPSSPEKLAARRNSTSLLHPGITRLFPVTNCIPSTISRIAETGEADRFDLVLKGKHEPYNRRLLAQLRPGGPNMVLKGTLAGQEVGVTSVSLQESRQYGMCRLLGGNRSTIRPTLAINTDKAVLGQMSDRLETLFQEITGKGAAATKTAAKAPDMAKLGEYEWLSAHQYKEKKAVAGMTQVKIRALMEAGGYDSGRFRVGLDPNLEALTSDMEPLKRKYAGFFGIKPHVKPS